MEKSFHSLPVSGSYVKSEAGAVGSVREDETNSMTDSGPVFTTGKAQEGGLPRPMQTPGHLAAAWSPNRQASGAKKG